MPWHPYEEEVDDAVMVKSVGDGMIVPGVTWMAYDADVPEPGRIGAEGEALPTVKAAVAATVSCTELELQGVVPNASSLCEGVKIRSQMQLAVFLHPTLLAESHRVGVIEMGMDAGLLFENVTCVD